MAKTFSILTALSGILVAIAGVFLHMSDTSLIKSFELGAQSPELFRLPNGVNEFDLLRINGIYYFASVIRQKLSYALHPQSTNW